MIMSKTYNLNHINESEKHHWNREHTTRDISTEFVQVWSECGQASSGVLVTSLSCLWQSLDCAECGPCRLVWWPAKANVKSPIMICPRCRPSSRKKYLSCLENNCCVTILYRASDVCQDQIGWQNGTKMGSFYKISSRKVSLTVNNPITPCALDDGENMKTLQSLCEI